jgi:hypothetical protein
MARLHLNKTVSERGYELETSELAGTILGL